MTIASQAFGEAPFASLSRESVVRILGEGTFEVADASAFRIYAGTREFITEPDDTPPNQPVYGTLQRASRFERSIIGSDGFGGATVGWGEMEIVNADGEYDQYIGAYAVDGRRVVLRAGLAGRPYGSFATVFDGTALDWLIDEDRVRIQLRDNGYKLEVPAQARLYGGTGGLDGTADLKGKRRPKALGEVGNVSPPLVVPSGLVYQVHDGPVEAIMAVYDRGVALTPGADHAGFAALATATVPSGHFATCRAEGLFRLGAAPAGTITADVRGDKTDGVYVNTVAAIIQRLVATATTVTAEDYDTLSFAVLEAEQSAPVGYWLAPDREVNVSDVIADLMASVGGWIGFTRAGKLQAGIFKAPGGSPVGRYDVVDVVSLSRIQLPAALSPPPWRFRVAWGRNWTVQDDVAGAVGADRVAYLSEPWRIAEASREAIRLGHPLAQDPAVVEAYFRDEADAAAEAARRLALYGPSAALYRIVIKGRLFAHDIGNVIALTYPRWDLGGGRLLRIVALSEDADENTVELTAFG